VFLPGRSSSSSYSKLALIKPQATDGVQQADSHMADQYQYEWFILYCSNKLD